MPGMYSPTYKKPVTKTVRTPFAQTQDPIARKRFLEANDVAPAQIDRLMGAATPTKSPAITSTAGGYNGPYQPAASGYSGGGGGGVSASSGKTQPATGDVWDGFARRYVPAERDLLFSNPDIIVRDWLSQGKYKGNDQMAGDLSRYANIMFGDDTQGGLYELLTGGSLNPKATGDDDQINALVDLLKQQTTVGGQSPSVQKMLQLLFEGFDNPNSTMGGMLTTGAGDDATTGQAINALMQYIPLLGQFTGNRRYSDAMYRQATRLANQYEDQQVKGKNTGSFVDFMKQNYLRG